MKPCPVCGGNGKMLSEREWFSVGCGDYYDDRTVWFVKCNNCVYHARKRYYPDDAMKEWEKNENEHV